MIDPSGISEIVRGILDDMPDGLKNMPADLQQNFKSALHSAFEKLDLVTREEFDAQRGVLMRTREKLEVLEKKIAEIEKNKS